MCDYSTAKFGRFSMHFNVAAKNEKKVDDIPIRSKKHRKNCECCPGYYLSTSVY